MKRHSSSQESQQQTDKTNLIKQRKELAPKFKQASDRLLTSSLVDVDVLSKDYNIQKQALLAILHKLGERPRQRLVDIFKNENEHMKLLDHQKQIMQATIQAAAEKAHQHVQLMSNLEKLLYVIPHSAQQEANKLLENIHFSDQSALVSSNRTTNYATLFSQLSHMKIPIKNQTSLAMVIQSGEDLASGAITEIAFINQANGTIQTTILTIDALPKNPVDIISQLRLASVIHGLDTSPTQIILCNSQKAEALRRLTGVHTNRTIQALTTQIMQADDDPSILAQQLTTITGASVPSEALVVLTPHQAMSSVTSQELRVEKVMSLLATYQETERLLTMRTKPVTAHTQVTTTPTINSRQGSLFKPFNTDTRTETKQMADEYEEEIKKGIDKNRPRNGG